MWECTPPCETRPSRWTSPPRSRRARTRRPVRRVLEERAVARPRVLPAPGPGTESGPSRSSDARPPSCPSGRRAARPPRPTPRAACADIAPRARRRPGSWRARPRSPGPAGHAPAVEDHERYEREAGPGRHSAEKDVGIEGGASDQGAVDVRLGEQLVGVLRLDGAAVDHARVVQRLDQAGPHARLRGRGRPVPIAQTGS